jgi:putative photosynthetic complex assembly protein
MMQTKAIGARKDYLSYGLGLVLAGVLALVMLNSDKNQEPRYQPNEAIFARNILFSDRVDGGISIRDAITGSFIGEIQPGEGGFVRGALRGFTRERRLESPGAESPLRLAALPDGAIILEDPTTGRWTDLRAFGATNVQSFASILFKKNEDGK